MIKKLLLVLLFVTPAFAQDSGYYPDQGPILSLSVPFSEKLNRSAPFTALPPGSISEAKNMKRIAPGIPSGWTARKGMTQHNSTAIGASTIDSLYQYVNKDFGTRIFAAQYGKTGIYSSTNDPPTSGTTFGTSIYTATGASGIAVCDHINDDWVCAVEGGDPFAWSGGTAYPDGFVVAEKFSSVSRNLVENGSFSVSGSPAQGWSESQCVGAITSGGYVGDGLEVTMDATTPLSYPGVYQNVPVAPSTSYDFKSTSKAITASAYVEFRQFDSAWGSGTSTTQINSTTDWVSDSDTVTTDADAAYVRVILNSLDDTVSAFDNIQIIGTGSKTVYRDGYEQVRNNDTGSSIIFVQAAAATEQAYIGFRRPIDGVYLYLGSTKNSVAATMSVAAIRNGTWTNVSGLSDGTASSGKTLAQNGAITWTANSSDDPYVVETTTDQLYWYRFTVSANITDGVEVYRCLVYDNCQKITNLSSGILQNPGTVVTKVGTSYETTTTEVTDGDAATTVGLPHPFTTSDSIFVGFAEEVFAIYLQIGSGANQTESSGNAVVKAYDPDNGWQTISTLIDGTSDGTYAFAQSGYLQWDATTITPSKTLLPDLLFTDIAEIPLYWYQITVSADSALSANEVAGIVQGSTFPEYKGVAQYHSRAIWWPSTAGAGGVDYSQDGFPHILNGTDSGGTGNIFGDGEVNAVVPMDDKAIVSTKNPSRLYSLSGAIPANYLSDLISANIGAVAPNSMVFVNGGIRLFSRDTLANAVAFLAPDGFYMTNGATVVDISTPVSDYFDTSAAPYIESSTMSNSYAWVNYDEKTVHFAVPINTTGSGTQSTLNRELVYNYFSDEWYDSYIRAYPAACGISIYGSDNSPLTYIGDYNGKVFNTNTGTADVSTEIDHYIKTAAISPFFGAIKDYLNYKADVRGIKLKAGADTASGSETKITAYPDGKTAAITVGDVSLERSGYSYINDYLTINSGTAGTPLTGEEFSFKFDNESVTNSIMTLYGFTIDYQARRPTY